MKTLPIAVLASGRGSNLQAIMDAIKKGQLACEVRVVISDCQGAMALERACRYGIPSFFIDPRKYPSKEDYEHEIILKLREKGAEIIALAGYMRLISRKLLQAFPRRIINIHPSLLPAFPGLEAQKQAWEYGVKYAGCTVHFVDEGMDTGPIIAQKVVPVEDGDTPETLTERILEQEHILYPQVLQWLAEGRVYLEGRRVKVEGLKVI